MWTENISKTELFGNDGVAEIMRNYLMRFQSENALTNFSGTFIYSVDEA